MLKLIDINPSRPDPRRREKLICHFIFTHLFGTTNGFMKDFIYEGLEGLHKIFWGTTKKCENNLL